MTDVLEVIEDDGPVQLIEDEDEAELISVNPDPPKKSRVRSALDAMVRGVKDVALETADMANSGLSDLYSGTSKAAHAFMQGNLEMLGEAGAETVKGTLNTVGAPYHAIFGGAPALVQDPILAAAGATQEQIEQARHTAEVGLGTIVPAGEWAIAASKAPLLSPKAPPRPRERVVDPETGAEILKNPPADPELQAAYLDELRAKGVDVTDSKQVAAHVAEREGVPAQVVVDESMPISKTQGTSVQIEPGNPGEVATRIEHEVGNHVPEKLGLKPPPVEDNNLLVLEGLEKERATFAQPVEPGQGLPGPHVDPNVNPALEALVVAQREAGSLGTRAAIDFQQVETIAAKGTIEKGLREAHREGGPKPETKTLRASERDVETYGQRLVAAARALREAYRNPNLQDPTSQLGIKMAIDDLEEAALRWNHLRFGMGRGVARFGKALDESLAGSTGKEASEIQSLLRSAGVKLEGSQLARQAYWTEGWKALARGEWQGVQDLSRFASLNLFSALSFAADAVSSVYRHTGALTGSAARDMVWLAKGHANFPNFGAYFRAMKRGELPTSIQQEIGHTISGEFAAGKGPWGEIVSQTAANYEAGGLKAALTTPLEVGSGVATHRAGMGKGIVKDVTGLGSFVFDELTSRPAYLKKNVDTMSGRVGASVKMSALADEYANLRGLTGEARAKFIDDFIANPPEGAQGEILRQGQELQWNVPVSEFEKAMSNQKYWSPFTRWFITAFPSWPSQFVRGMADVMGVRPAAWRRILKAAPEMQPFEIAEQVGKMATGWGSVYLASLLYDSVDFDSMELVNVGKEGAERFRLSGLDPLPELLGLVALFRGDTERIAASIKHSNIPLLSSFFARGGGIATPLVKNFQNFSERGTFNAQKAQKEMTDLLNSLYPGQATLAAFKSALDPVNRQGPTRNLPGLSQDAPAVRDVTTGEEQVVQQRIPGADVRFRNVAGAPIRGVARETDAVFELLDYYVPEAIIRSGVRTPFAGLNVSEVPVEQQDEYKAIFGKERWRLLSSKKDGALAGMFQAGRLPARGTPGYEKVRKKIKSLDSQAARFAANQLKKKYGAKKPARRTTILEGSGWNYQPVAEEPIEEGPTVIEAEE